MKSKRLLIGAFAILIIIMIFLIPKSKKTSFGLRKSGSVYENMSDFLLYSSDESDEMGKPDKLTQSFLKSIHYEITDIDKEKMTAVVEVNVPKMADTLSEVLDKVIENNSDKDKEELIRIAESELSSMLSSNQIETQKSTITLQIEETDGFYKLVPSEELDGVITGELDNLYMSYLKSLLGGITDELPE